MPHLHAALLPPRPLLEAVQATARVAAEAVPPTAPVVPEPASRWSRLLGRSARPTPPAEPVEAGSSLSFIPVEAINLPVASLGSVTVGDTARLVRALSKTMAQHQPPTVWFAGGVAPPPATLRDEEVLNATLAGDLKELGDIARAVPRAVEAVGFYVDRRVYRPAVAIARVDGVPSDELERVFAALEEFRGEQWRVAHLSLMKRVHADGDLDSTELERIPIGEG